MAEDFVGVVQFGEFVKRIEERFDYLGKELVNMNTLADQRFDNLEKRLDFQNRMTLAVYITVGAGILASLVRDLFFSG